METEVSALTGVPHSCAHVHIGDSAGGNAAQHQPEPLRFCFLVANVPFQWVGGRSRIS